MELTAEALAAFKSLLEKNGGDSAKLAEKLFDDNHALREDKRKLKDEAAALKAKVPAEGSRVLTADEMKAWDELKALGKPEEIKAAFGTVKELQGKLSKVERDKLLEEAAGAHGFKPHVLGKMPGLDRLTIEVRTVKQDGKDTKVAHVKDELGQTRTLAEYAEAEWSDFLPALTLTAASAQPPGTKWVDQSSGGKAPKQDQVEAFIEAQRKRGDRQANPLIPTSNK